MKPQVRYQLRRRQRPAQKLPPWLRPKLSAEQRFGLSLSHHVNLDALASGTAEPHILWDWIGGALMWHHITTTLHQRNPHAYRESMEHFITEFRAVQSVVQRYRTTGVVQLTADEVQIVRESCQWAEALAEVVDQPTVEQCAALSEQTCQRLANQSATGHDLSAGIGSAS